MSDGAVATVGVSRLCRIELFGGMRVVLPDREVVRFPTQRTAALLAYLALHPGRHFPRETVAELLWPEGDPRAIRNRLNQAVSSLRRILHGPESGGGVFEANHQYVRLLADRVSTDVGDFRESFRLGRGKVDGFERENWLRRAYDLYKGELLEGFYDDWLFSPRLSLAHTFNEVAVDLAEHYLRHGHIDEAIAVGMRRLELDAADESAHLTVIHAQLSAGRPQFARRQWEAMVQALNALQIGPSSAAMRVAERIVNAESPAPAELIASLSRVSAPERSPRQPLLPVMPGRFVGRQAEISTLLELLCDEGLGPITICGLAGIGKTRLALEIAGSQPKRFANVAFVSSGAQALRAIAHAAGVEEASDDAALLGDRLAAAGGALVVVDAATASDAEWVGMLASRSPNVRLLVTALRPLAIVNERLMPLSPLEGCRTDSTVQELVAAPSTQLFIAAAQARKSDFQVTAGNFSAVRELIHKLEGHPLALEFAARWVRVLTPKQMLNELFSDFGRFAEREGQARRSLNTSFELSFAALEPELMEAAMRLAGFARDFDAHSAAAIGVDRLETIRDLEVAGWLLVEARGDEARYRMPWLARSFIRARTPTALRAEIAGLIAVNTVARLESGQQIDDLDALAALEWLWQRGDSRQAARTALKVTGQLIRQGRLSASRRLLEKALESPRADELSAEIVGRLRLMLGMANEFLGERGVARKLYDEASRSLGPQISDADRYELNFARSRLAHYAAVYPEARHILEKMIAEDPPSAILQRAWLGVGNALAEEGDLDAANQAYVESLVQADRMGKPMARATTLVNLANLAMMRGDVEASRAWLAEAHDLVPAYLHPWFAAVSLLVEAKLARVLDDRKAGREALTRLIDLDPEELTIQINVMLECAYASEDPVASAKLIGFGKGYVRRLGALIVGTEQDTLKVRSPGLVERLGPKRFDQLVRLGEAMSWDQAWRLARRQIGF